MNEVIRNPVLRGFHPDPSLLRVGGDYYIATSTFEWFPGVQIHHSRDLVNWRLLTYPLTRRSQLNMKGNIDSGGVWAPCLSYDNGIYYLIYTDVKSRQGAFKDTHNYLVTAPDITGPWSEPIYLNSSGFDPSLFHDDDGRKWIVNMRWDHRKGVNHFAGIVLQEYDVEQQKRVGPVHDIFRGTDLKLTEGPHLYKYDGLYYLLTAEGGTQYEHAVTMARSQHLKGPYEVDPQGPVLTSAGAPELALQKAGHGSLVVTPDGEWYMAHLCGRPVEGKYCILGRETAIQHCTWTEDGWLRLADGGNRPQTEVPAPKLPPHIFEGVPERDDFDKPELNLHFNSLRIPTDESWMSLQERPGYLRLRGMESMSSTHQQSLIARRQQAMYCEAETVLEYEPQHAQQMAGLILYYDTQDYVYLRVTRNETAGKCIGILQSVDGQYDELPGREISLEGVSRIGLKCVIERNLAQFWYAADGGAWMKVGEKLAITHLSDDFPSYIRFTGNFIGMCAQDLSGDRLAADFDYFMYKEREK